MAVLVGITTLRKYVYVDVLVPGMVSDWSRRSLLGGLGTAALTALAGCSDSLAAGRGATDILLHNESTNTLSVDVHVTGTNTDEPRIDTTVALDPNTRHKFNSDVLMNADYDVQITALEPSADESETTGTHEWNNADHTLHALIDEEIVFAVQV